MRLYWYRNEPNFGDAFSPMVVEHCFGCKVSHSGKWSADIVAEGSVLDFTLLRDVPARTLAAARLRIRASFNRRLRRSLLVWGSGMLFPLERRKVEIPIRRPKFLALRGERTRREMASCGLLDAKADLVLGDPGLFMPEVLAIAPRPKWNRGFVVHACLWASGDAMRFAREHPDIRLIDPRRTPTEVVGEIAECREVFSSSLHGLVAADALGIPNRWVALETPHADAMRNRFKFEDYYSAFGVNRQPCAMSEVAHAVPSSPISREMVLQTCRALRDAAERAEAED